MVQNSCPRGVFALDWAQTETDGIPGAPEDALRPGAEWRYHGAALRMDRAGNVLDLPLPSVLTGLRRRAAGIAARLSGREAPMRAPVDDTPPEAPTDGFTLTDGHARFEGRLLRAPDGALRAVVITPALPAPGQPLWVLACTPGRATREDLRLACAGADTLIDTPQGPRPADSLRAGDLVLTVDAGAQPLLSVQHQRLDAETLRRRPALRPIRIAPGALPGLTLSEALTLGPDQRILLTDPRATALFGCDQVLARARDLLDHHGIRTDHAPHGASYVHLLLEGHHLLQAQGAVIDSLHPAEAAPATRPHLTDPAADAPYVRRLLDTGETALLAA